MSCQIQFENGLLKKYHDLRSLKIEKDTISLIKVIF